MPNTPKPLALLHNELLFVTERLTIRTLTTFTDIPLAHLRLFLTPRASEYLPSSWQQLDSDSQVLAWAKAQVAQGDMYAIYTQTSPLPIGLLFLYGYADCVTGSSDTENKRSGEVRLGYVFCESAWGVGYASELLLGLVTFAAASPVIGSLVGGVVAENIASAKAMTKNGFIKTEAQAEGETVFYQWRRQ